MAAARNLLNDWQRGELDEAQDFEPMNPNTHTLDQLPETVKRRSNRKMIDKARARRREQKEKLLETDARESASA